MKIIAAKSFFKKARVGSVNAGVKREDLVWSYEGLDASDVASLAQADVARVLNNFIESYGRKLIAASGDDWNFTVEPAQCNFAVAFADLIAERTSGRILTKESLARFADVYVAVMVATGVPVKAANTVASLIREKFASVAGKTDVIEAIANRIAQFCDSASDDDLEPIADVVDAIVTLLDDLKAPAEITVDAI